MLKKQNHDVHSGTKTFMCVGSNKAGNQTHPAENEDCLLVDRRRSLFGVFDGIGGRGNGRLASGLAVHTIRTGWKRLYKAALLAEKAQIEVMLQNLLEQAHEQIAALAIPLVQKRPATTAVLAMLGANSEGAWMTSASVGDSRLYLLREQHDLQRVTEDDGYFPFAVRKGWLRQEDARRIEQATASSVFSAADLQHFNKRNKITCALGWEEFQAAQTKTLALCPGDRILLCTDGIHDNLTDHEMEVLLRKGAFATSAQRLVRAAYRRSQQEQMRAKPDDMSAVILMYNGVE
jgi:protein phosphatase